MLGMLLFLVFFGSIRRSLPLLPLEENDKDAAMKVLERQDAWGISDLLKWSAKWRSFFKDVSQHNMWMMWMVTGSRGESPNLHANFEWWKIQPSRLFLLACEACKAISAMESGPLLLYRPVFGCLHLDFQDAMAQVWQKPGVGEYSTYYILHQGLAPYGNPY